MIIAALRINARNVLGLSPHSIPTAKSKWHNKQMPPAPTETFDRNAHGLNGLPTCRHCRHPLRQWDGLVKHIQRQRCQALRAQARPEPKPHSAATLEVQSIAPVDEPTSGPADPPSSQILSEAAPSMGDGTTNTMITLQVPTPATESSAQQAPQHDMPLLQWPGVQAKLREGRWTDLLLDNHVQEYLQHHCPVCYQWMATAASIKCHLTVQHAEWTACQPEALKLLQGFRRRTVVPCRYCHLDNVNKDRHWRQCHVLHICAFLAVQYGSHSERSNGARCPGEAVLVPCGTAETGTRSSQASDKEHDRGCQETATGATRQGQGKGKGSKGQSKGYQRPGPPSSGATQVVPTSRQRVPGIPRRTSRAKWITARSG